jgi:hypothetical protein
MSEFFVDELSNAAGNGPVQLPFGYKGSSLGTLPPSTAVGFVNAVILDSTYAVDDTYQTLGDITLSLGGWLIWAMVINTPNGASFTNPVQAIGNYINISDPASSISSPLGVGSTFWLNNSPSTFNGAILPLGPLLIRSDGTDLIFKGTGPSGADQTSSGNQVVRLRGKMNNIASGNPAYSGAFYYQKIF